MAVQLFEHNAKAYQAAVKMMQQYGKAAIVHPTGTGKSYIADVYKRQEHGSAAWGDVFRLNKFYMDKRGPNPVSYTHLMAKNNLMARTAAHRAAPCR